MEQQKKALRKQYAEFDTAVYNVARRYWPLSDATPAFVEPPRHIIKCQLRDKTSKYMKKFKKTEDMPGFAPIDVANWRTPAVLKDQPEWRLDFFKKNKGAIKEYAKAPRELRIDPTFCPTPRQLTWEGFERFSSSNPNALNWPVLPSPPEGQAITETWFLEACTNIEEKFRDIPDLSCQMLCKFMRLFKACIETFKPVEKERTDWSRYADPDRGLAFDFAIGPEDYQQWGYYARLQNLQSHYMNTWEEMAVSEFLPTVDRVFNPFTQPNTTRFLAFCRAQMETSVPRARYTTEEVRLERAIFESLRPPKPSRGRSGLGRGE